MRGCRTVREFSPQFKEDAIALIFNSGRLVAQIASEIGVVEAALENRVQTWKEAHLEVGNAERGPADGRGTRRCSSRSRSWSRSRKPGKSQRFFCREPAVTDVFGFIRSVKACLPVPRMCHKFGVARASFYRWFNTKF